MLKRHAICSSFLLLILSLTTARAQNEVAKTNKSSAVTITASASGERVRFTAPSSVVQIRLEIYNSTGKKLFDNEVRGGNVLDWHLQDGQAEPLADDSYLCMVTVKSLSGKLTQRIGSVRVEKSTASVQAAAASQMTAQQTEAIGPVEENASVTVLTEGETQTTTVIAHNGTEGQLIRGQGALSFRLGDFFSGKDTEQMRLTPEGNLGIGITHPQARLDVDGLIRTSQGIVFSDGTIQTTAANGASGIQTPDKNLGGGKLLGSTNQSTSSAKDGKGKKKVSPELFVNEDLTVNGNIIFTPQLGRDITMQQNVGGIRIFAAPTLTTTPSSAAIQFFGNGHGGFPGQAYIDSGAHDQAAVIFRTAQAGGTITERMRVTAGGNVGIGTTGPSQLLHLSRGGAGSSTDIQLDNTDTGGVSWAISSVGNIGGRVGNFEIKRPGVSNPFQITPSGFVGIGTTTPTDKLHILTTNSGEGISISDGVATLRAKIESFFNPFLGITVRTVNLGTSSPEILTLMTNNQPSVYIGYSGLMFPALDNFASLGASGSRWSAVYAANGTIQTSDARLKKTVTNLGYGLSQVMQLRPVSFQWKDRTDGRTHLGLIAQEVESVIPEAVEKDKNPATPLGMNYTSLIPVVIKAIQEQQITLSTLKAENAALNARLAGLEKTIDADLALARQRHSRLRGVKHVLSTGNSTPSRSKAGSGLVAQN